MQADDGLDGAELLAEAAPPPAAANTPAPPARLRDALNPLLSVAAPVLALATSLRDRALSDPPRAAAAALERFDRAAAAAGLDPDDIRAARIALAATLDDVARAAGHGGAAVAEPGAGVRFFDLLDGMLGDPRRHRHALELFYACLSLGFEGRFRDKPGGAHDLARLRDELYRILRRARGDVPAELSPAWTGVAEPFRPPGNRLGNRLGGGLPGWPGWLIWAAVALGLSGLYVHFAGGLDRRAEPVAARIAALLPDRPIEIARLVPPPPPTAGPALIARITGRLAPEIRTGSVEVLAGEDGALVIRIPAAAMFATGSDAVKARHRAIVERVGQTLATESGGVLVVAHTDDQTPPTGRLATAQSLTDARAEAVRKLLEHTIAPARLSAEGHGDQEPVALNDTPAGRDANRRVDIRLYPQ
ncbi:DotU family type IV/VI secretion system protein [Azospirillum oryzae]|uniref:DotU family type IV/VI secretion system protein n=1 Tax=Azospirillum oryzae TaxID=286727 RepID=A0A6N1ANZ0_9PROT|nr:type IVB secretion system protein IcmH/DotU [Azospirillum oryzae]KAA0584593.1 OmpA family protein [Azospirillum oryzae]QKS50744.1 DotU family type IV/VI secretion system protein [Azospirillum oryzae]